MLQKLLATAAFTLALSLSAVAQDSTTSASDNAGNPSSSTTGAEAGDTTGAMDPMPPAWNGAIADTFYSDVTARAMREEADMATRWGALTADQQAQVKSDCTSMSAASQYVPRRAKFHGKTLPSTESARP